LILPEEVWRRGRNTGILRLRLRMTMLMTMTMLYDHTFFHLKDRQMGKEWDGIGHLGRGIQCCRGGGAVPPRVSVGQ
jgi:hypothetical protein